MVVFRKRKKARRIVYSWLTLFVLGIVSGIVLYGAVGMITKNQETKRNKVVALNQLAALEEREDQLESVIENLKTDQGIEKVIREKFSVVKEGEEFIVIIEDEKNDQNQDKNKKRINFIQFFKNLLMRSAN